MYRSRAILAVTMIMLLLAQSFATVAYGQRDEAGSGPIVLYYPGVVLEKGSPGLVVTEYSSIVVVLVVNGSYTTNDGGKVTISGTTRAEIAGVPWPFEPGLYMYLLPSMPSGVYLTRNGVLEISVRALLYTTGGMNIGGVEWSEEGARLEPIVLMVAEDYNEWTLGLSPAGWSWPGGEPLNVTIAAIGYGDDVDVNLVYRRIGGGPVALPTKPYEGWTPLYSIVWYVERLLSNAGVNVDAIPDIGVGGTARIGTLPGMPEGAGVEYWGRIVVNDTVIRTLTGLVWFDKPGGQQILVVDDDQLLYLLAVNESGSRQAEKVHIAPGMLPEASRAASSLYAAGLVRFHDWSSLARIGDIYIAFPGEEAVARAGEAALIWVSGLPPAVPGTILDWSESGMVGVVASLAQRGTPLVATYTAIASLPDCETGFNPYPGLVGTGIDTMSEALGLKLLSLAASIQECPPTILPRGGGDPVLFQAPTPRVSGLNIQLFNASSVPTVAGIQAILSERVAPSPIGDPDSLPAVVGTWQMLVVNKPGGDVNWTRLVSLASNIQEVAGETRALLAGMERLGADEVIIGGVSLDAKVLASSLSIHAQPVMLSSDGSYGIYLYDDGDRRAAYLTFEVESIPGNEARSLQSWIAKWAMSEPQSKPAYQGVALPRPAVDLLSNVPGDAGVTITVAVSGKTYRVEVPDGAHKVAIAASYGSLKVQLTTGQARSWRVVEVEGPARVPYTVYSPLILVPVVEAVWKVEAQATTTTTQTPAQGGVPPSNTTQAGGQAETTTQASPGPGPGEEGQETTTLLLYGLLVGSLISIVAAAIYIWERKKYSYY